MPIEFVFDRDAVLHEGNDQALQAARNRQPDNHFLFF